MNDNGGPSKSPVAGRMWNPTGEALCHSVLLMVDTLSTLAHVGRVNRESHAARMAFGTVIEGAQAPCVHLAGHLEDGVNENRRKATTAQSSPGNKNWHDCTVMRKDGRSGGAVPRRVGAREAQPTSRGVASEVVRAGAQPPPRTRGTSELF